MKHPTTPMAKTASTASAIASLDDFTNMLGSFEFRRTPPAVEAMREYGEPSVSRLPACPVCRERELRRLRRDKSRLSKLVLQPGVLAAVLFDFPPDCGVAQ